MNESSMNRNKITFILYSCIVYYFFNVFSSDKCVLFLIVTIQNRTWVSSFIVRIIGKSGRGYGMSEIGGTSGVMALLCVITALAKIWHPALTCSLK